MGLFGNIFKKAGIVIGSPATGKCIPIQEVNDPTFAEEMLGKGVAIIPESNIFVAPANGIIATAFSTGHAVGLTTDDGVELLIHVGLDTVNLNGKHFQLKVTEGQKVCKGDVLIEVDLQAVKDAGYDVTTPVIVCNSGDFKEVHAMFGKNAAQLDDILTIEK